MGIGVDQSAVCTWVLELIRVLSAHGGLVLIGVGHGLLGYG